MKINLRDFNLPEVLGREALNAVTIAHVAVRLSAVEARVADNTAITDEKFIKRINSQPDQNLITNVKSRGDNGRIAYEVFLSKVAAEITHQWHIEIDGEKWSSEWEIPGEILFPFIKEGLGYESIPNKPPQEASPVT